jgi:hypothetical protein
MSCHFVLGRAPLERRNVIDLARVDAIDAAGIGALVSLQAGVSVRPMKPIEQAKEISKGQPTGLGLCLRQIRALMTDVDYAVRRVVANRQTAFGQRGQAPFGGMKTSGLDAKVRT